MGKPHPIFQAIQEIAEETYHSYGDATQDDWHDCVIFGVESFVYGMDNGSEWTFVEVMSACGAPLPTEVEWTVRGPGGGYPTEIRNVAEYARDEYDGDETEFLNVSYRRGYDGSFHPGLGNMMVSALERKALEVCTLPVPPAPVEVEILAAEFATAVRQTFTRAELEDVDCKNAALPAGSIICHLHDISDANVLMDYAWGRAFSNEFDPASEHDAALWGAAWDIVKAQGFAGDDGLFPGDDGHDDPYPH